MQSDEALFETVNLTREVGSKRENERERERERERDAKFCVVSTAAEEARKAIWEA